MLDSGDKTVNKTDAVSYWTYFHTMRVWKVFPLRPHTFSTKFYLSFQFPLKSTSSSITSVWNDLSVLNPCLHFCLYSEVAYYLTCGFDSAPWVSCAGYKLLKKQHLLLSPSPSRALHRVLAQKWAGFTTDAWAWISFQQPQMNVNMHLPLFLLLQELFPLVQHSHS